MRYPTNGKADPCKDRPETTTNERKHTPVSARNASPRRDDRRGWRPVRLGELIERAMAGIKVAEARP